MSLPVGPPESARLLPLGGIRFLSVGQHPGAQYAARLLELLGAEVLQVGHPRPDGLAAPSSPLRPPAETRPRAEDLRSLPVAAALDATGSLSTTPFPTIRPRPAMPAAEAWARCGGMSLTGLADGPPLLAPGDAATALDGAALALEVLAATRGYDVSLEGAALLGERAALAGLRRRGSISPGGGCRLLRAADGWLAVSLSRAEDLEMVPVWIGRHGPVWDTLGEEVARSSSLGAAERAQMLGLAVATLGPPQVDDEQLRARHQVWPPAPWLIDGAAPSAGGKHDSCDADQTSRPALEDVTRLPPSRRVQRGEALVVDLSALWAGPLATSLLAQAGCRVLKVEDPTRPDPVRQALPRFFDLLNAGKESVTVPIAADGPLKSLIASADLVVEASRPRALENLGLVPRHDQAWLSITGYGRQGPWRQRAAYGDDAAAAAGFVVWPAAGAPPCFCADAAADPMTGLHAAVAALAAIVGGRPSTLDVAMREVVGHVLGLPTPPVGNIHDLNACPARSRLPLAAARPLGTDTARVLAAL